MSGHGHVTPNADGSKARCGGPAICRECQAEAGRFTGRATETSETGYREDCCFNDFRDQCPRFAPKGSCKCRCHVDMPPPTTGRDRQMLLWVADDLRWAAEAHLKSADICGKRIERKHLKQIADALLERARFYERRAAQRGQEG